MSRAIKRRGAIYRLVVEQDREDLALPKSKVSCEHGMMVMYGHSQRSSALSILGWLVSYVVVSAPENHLFESKGEKEIAVVFQGHKLREKSLVESAAKKRRF